MNFRQLTGAFVAFFALTAQAAAWPTKPVQIVVPYPPGGNVDVAARILGPGLEKELGQPFIVENKAGAGGLIAGRHVARSDADGYTFFMAANGPLLFSPIIFDRPDYHWDKDFEPISTVSLTPLVLQANPSFPVSSFTELVDYAKAHPDDITMASPGAGTSNHLLSELLQKEAGVEWLTIHYKGNAPATTDLIAGRLDFSFDQVSVALPYIEQGKLKALGVTSESRVPSLPDVPTMQEQGLEDFVAYTFTGILAPKGTSADIVDRFSAALSKVLADPDVIEKFRNLGAEAKSLSPDEFHAYLASEEKRWVPIIESSNITAQ